MHHVCYQFDLYIINCLQLTTLSVPGCGHCKKAKPEFVEAADTFKEDPRVELAAVDCTRHSALCQSFSVQGYPTIKYFSYLKTSRDYSGGRTVEYSCFIDKKEKLLRNR